ncbi:uncharacterized protein LOC133718451 [Rosa rugosa]|uniref:uncharacterized protein LOC133718451 n=1 Tax=Rosa rugosa TaxID=74645 RepID=UPI002B411E89|nr:uncharacterized protein LOC133718451 [Rosa rugosa]
MDCRSPNLIWKWNRICVLSKGGFHHLKVVIGPLTYLLVLLVSEFEQVECIGFLPGLLFHGSKGVIRTLNSNIVFSTIGVIEDEHTHVLSYIRSLSKAPVVTNCLASGMEGTTFVICFKTNGHGL